MIIYEDETGYIKGYELRDGSWWIEEFVILKEYRGKKLARKLAQHLPKNASLLATPMVNMDGLNIAQEILERFYKSLGFVLDRECGMPIMHRVCRK